MGTSVISKIKPFLRTKFAKWGHKLMSVRHSCYGTLKHYLVSNLYELLVKQASKKVSLPLGSFSTVPEKNQFNSKLF